MSKEQALKVIAALATDITNRDANLNTGEARTAMLRALVLVEKYVVDSGSLNPNAIAETKTIH